MRDADTSNKLSVDRYDLIRSFQQEQQPRPNLLVPVNEAPVAPPLPRLEDSVVPISAPQSSPGTSRPSTPPAVAAAVDPESPSRSPAPPPASAPGS